MHLPFPEACIFCLVHISVNSSRTLITMTTAPSSFCPQLTKQQLDVLEAEFCINPRPDITTRDRLAQTLKLSNLFIYVWFLVRRLRSVGLHRRQPHRPAQICHMHRHSIIYHPVRPYISSETSAKRKSPFNVDDHEKTLQPTKKPTTIPASMSARPTLNTSRLPCLPLTSSSHHPLCNSTIQQRLSRDQPSAIASLMSVEFLSRSSHTAACTPNVGVRLLS
nr:homeobox transcriptional repressor [Paracentrotus lividus]